MLKQKVEKHIIPSKHALKMYSLQLIILTRVCIRYTGSWMDGAGSRAEEVEENVLVSHLFPRLSLE